jgi:hypothetical protein
LSNPGQNAGFGNPAGAVGGIISLRIPYAISPGNASILLAAARDGGHPECVTIMPHFQPMLYNKRGAFITIFAPSYNELPRIL